MITFRYHLASLVAVLLALAAGIALGAGALDDGGTPSGADGSTPVAATEIQTRFTTLSDAFATSVQASLLANTLSGRTVTMLVLPGASGEEVSALTGAVGQAGGAVATVIRLGDGLVDASKKQLVDQLGGQLEAAATNLTLPPGASTYDRLGTLLGYAVATKNPAGDAVDDQGKGIMAGLTTSGLVTVEGDLQRRGGLVLVAGGPPPSSDARARGAASIVLSLVKALDAMSGGVVVAAPASAAEANGVLTGIRGDTGAAGAVSTADTADHPVGVIATVLALAEQAAGKAGQYGSGPGATGVRPGVPAP